MVDFYFGKWLSKRQIPQFNFLQYVCVCVCLEVSISNVIPESLDICPQLHLKQISQSSGITLLTHTHTHTHTPPDRMDYMYIFSAITFFIFTDKRLHVSFDVTIHFSSINQLL